MLLINNLRGRITRIANVLRAAVFDVRPFLLALLVALLTLLVAQAPLNYRFNVGFERGPKSDLPFLQSFYPPEGQFPDGMFRWSRTEYALLELPGIGQRIVTLSFTIASHRAQHDLAQPATMLTLRHTGTTTSPSFALRREAAHYQVLLPSDALPDGVLRLNFDTPTWQNPGDSRDEIGIALAQQVVLRSTATTLPIMPDLGLLGGLIIGVLLTWGAARVSGFHRNQAALLVLPVAIILPLLGLIDTARAGYLGPWMLPTGLLLLGAAAANMTVFPFLLRQAGSMPQRSTLSWLVLLSALVFALKYGGRFYPDAMPGDWQLHINRFSTTVIGDLSIRAQHRGLPFPFPQGYYLDIAPLILLGVDIRPLLPLLAGLLEAVSVPVLYALMARATHSERMALLAAAIYAGTAHGFMNTWFSFHTQISTQFFTALLMLMLVITWPDYHRPTVWWPLLLLLTQQFLGHIGTFINAGLLGTFVVIVLWLRATTPHERRAVRALLSAGVTAFLLAMLGYYSLFSGLIIEQITGVATQGLVEVTGKKPIPAATHLQVLWEGGLITHYGFFPILLAIPGLLWLSRRLRGSPLPLLLWGTLLISAAQGLLPFLTQSAIMTRWLTFAAWAIAIAGAAGLALWWRHGRAAKLAGLAMAGYVLWITATIFAEAMTQRLPPIEPF